MTSPEILHNPRVFAGTLSGFEGFRRFRSRVVDPVRHLLPVAVEVEAVPPSRAPAICEFLAARGFFVDDRRAAAGRLAVAGSLDRFELLSDLEEDRPPGILPLAAAIARAVALRFVETFEVPLPRGLLRLGRRPLVMGVLNVTPDSFSDGGRYLAAEAAIERALEMVKEGADLIDVGAESTRPGAKPVPVGEEIQRLEPVLDVLVERAGVPISLDTRKAEVAEHFLPRGVDIVNDVSGLTFDRRMGEVVARHRAALVVTHSRGVPESMQDDPVYEDAPADVARELRERIARARAAGVAEERILIDPGIGFGKRLEDNLDLLARIEELRSLGRPILVGCSRKSFLGKITGRAPEERVAATSATTALAALRGVKIVRVHDVREAIDVVSVLEAIDARHPVA